MLQATGSQILWPCKPQCRLQEQADRLLKLNSPRCAVCVALSHMTFSPCHACSILWCFGMQLYCPEAKMRPERKHASLLFFQGPSLQMIRRHSRSSEQMHYGPALHTVTGNWVAGKRKGVIGGIDFGSTGMVCPATTYVRAHDCSHILKHHANTLVCWQQSSVCCKVPSCLATSHSSATVLGLDLRRHGIKMQIVFAGALCAGRCNQEAAERWTHCAAGQPGLQRSRGSSQL